MPYTADRAVLNVATLDIQPNPDQPRRTFAFAELAGLAQSIGENGMLKQGVIVRFLLLPGHLIEAKMLLKYAYDTYGEQIYYSLMSQYTPTASLPSPLNRTVNEREYRSFVAYAEHLGIQNAFVQELGSASESFIHEF